MIVSFVFVVCYHLMSVSQSEKWVGTWSTAVQPMGPLRQSLFTNITLRQIVRVSIGGSIVRFRFSNVYSDGDVMIQSAAVAVSKGRSAIDATSVKFLMFSGGGNVTLPPKGEVYSDPVAFPLEKNSLLAITVCFGNTSSLMTGHMLSLSTSYVSSGCHVADANLNKTGTFDAYIAIQSVDVGGAAQSASVVALGDSITDGMMLPANKHTRWTDVLATRMQSSTTTAGVGVLNVGMNGNALALHGMGPTMLARFERDVLSQSGVRWVIVLGGVNDLASLRGMQYEKKGRRKSKEESGEGKESGGERRESKERKRLSDETSKRDESSVEHKPQNENKGKKKDGRRKQENEEEKEEYMSERISSVVKNMTDAYTEMISKAHANGIKVIGCTLLPFAKSQFASEYGLRAWMMVNEWIRTAGAFDAVVDAGALLASAKEPNELCKEILVGDSLHLSEAGHRRLGEAFDLQLFGLDSTVKNGRARGEL